MHFLYSLVLGTPLWMWLIFFVVIVLALAFDLGVLNKKDHVISLSESLKLSALYITLGLCFSLFILWREGGSSAAQYLTAFVVEKSLSLDNIFVMALIFGYFAIPQHLQHRVLFWGILGAIILRGIMIGFGAGIVEHYHWVLYLFAAFLIFTGIKMLFVSDEDPDLSNNRLIAFVNRHFRFTEDLCGHAFFLRRPHPEGHPRSGKMALYATPMFLTLVVIELADVTFAVDSIPAVFTITTDTFLVFTSNIFAILGLRALYFALSAILRRFEHMKYALSLLLTFIGAKTFIAWGLGWDKFPPVWSLFITVIILGAGVIWSLVQTTPADAEDTDAMQEQEGQHSLR